MSTATVSLVTGASKGIGRAIALRLASRGDSVVASARSSELLDSLAAEAKGLPGKIIPCPADFTAHSGDAVNWQDFFWDVSSLERSTFAVRERIGYLWIWLRGRG